MKHKWLMLLLGAFSIFGIIPAHDFDSALPLDPEYPGNYNTVALVYKKNGKVFCTGSLIKNKMILTARHCLANKKPEKIQVYFGIDTNEKKESLYREVESFKLFSNDKNWKEYFPNGDIAFLNLSVEPPVYNDKDIMIRPIDILKSENLLKGEQDIDLVGHGNNSATFGVSAGIRLKIVTTYKEFYDSNILNSILFFDGVDGGGACHGDSGGPAYTNINGIWYLVGITNGFDPVLTPDAMRESNDRQFPYIIDCTKNQILYTFAGHYLSWIEEHSDEGFGCHTSPCRPLLEYKEIDKTKLQEFKQWCENIHPDDDAWPTVKGIIDYASDHLELSKEERKRLYTDCNYAHNMVGQIESFYYDESYPIGNLAPLASLRNLKKLNLSPRNYSEFGFYGLEKSKSIEELNISKIGITDLFFIEPLAEISTLKKLSLEKNEIYFLDGIEKFGNLESLDLSGTKIFDLELLSNLKELKELDLSKTQIGDLYSLVQNEKLESLNLSYANADGYEGLNDIQSLKTLILNSSNFDTFSDIEFLNLKVLEASSVYAYDHEYIASQIELEEIKLFATSLFDLDFLENMVNLKRVQIVDSMVEDVQVFSRAPHGFKYLEYLNLSANRVTTVADLLDLQGLLFLNLNRNPLEKRTCPIDIPQRSVAKVCNRLMR